MEEAIKKIGKVPKGPRQPIDLNMTPEQFESIEKLIAEFGDICKVSAISRNSDRYIIKHHDYVKRVLLQNHQNYLKGVGFDRVKMLLGNGIIVSDGPFWRRQRRMMQPAFNRKVTAQLSVQIKKCNLDLFKKWQISYDNYTVTHNPTHIEFVRNFYMDIQKNGYIFERELDSLSCEHDKLFLPD